MLKLKLQYSGHLMWRANSLEKTLMLGNVEGRRRRGNRMSWLDVTTDSVDIRLSKLRETVKDREACCPAVHGSQRVRHDWVTDNNNGEDDDIFKLWKSNMDGSRGYHTKWNTKSDTERQISHTITYMWNLKRWDKSTYLRNRNRLTDFKTTLWLPKRKAKWGRDKLRVWD